MSIKVPFGKYKGQDIEKFINDTYYRVWCFAQQDLVIKYKEFFTEVCKRLGISLELIELLTKKS